jgi:hypothetical protein
MALCTVTVNNESPALEKKFQEATLIVEALELAAAAIGQGRGLVTSGTMTKGNPAGAGVTTLGTWAITLQAAS